MGFPAALAAASTAFKTIGALEQGRQEAASYGYQAQVAINNATIAGQNATYETQLGEQQVIRRQLAGGQMIGTQRAHAGASGVDPNSGSALRAQEDTAALTAGDVGVIRNNAARRAYNFTTEGSNYTAQAGMDAAAGENANKNAAWNALSTIATGSSSVADKWYRWDAQKGGGLGAGGEDMGV